MGNMAATKKQNKQNKIKEKKLNKTKNKIK